MDYIINCLTQKTPVNETCSIINFSSALPFELCSVEYPKKDDAKNGYAYMIVSIPQPTVTYIGQTQDLHERINQHNKGWTHHWTDSITLRPWACMAYIVGFQSKNQRVYFESLWQNLVIHSYSHQTATPYQVLHTAQLAMFKYHEKYNITTNMYKLRMVQILSPKSIKVILY